MKYLLTIRTEAGERTRIAIGNRDALMDAAYAAGALGIFIRSLP